jgi:excinuclease UvrABC ATPase subunit
VGLDYLSTARASMTLSGGESQRIRLATQIGSGLMGVLYVCDEPTVGLHPADDYRLIQTMQRLRDLGNTILVVETKNYAKGIEVKFHGVLLEHHLATIDIQKIERRSASR